MEMHLSSWMMCLFFVTLEKSAAFSTSARSTRWHKFPSDSADIDETSAVAVGSRSVKECAIRCLDHVNCDRFCYDVMNAVCYVTGVVTSSTPVSDPERRCYEVNSAPAPVCPTSEGYAMYGPFCLKIYLPTMNYTDAQDLCAGDGAHLYHYKNLADYRAPLEELLAANGDPAYIWVGAERPANDLTADFTWTDGTLLSDTADVWRDGEPTGGLNERCAEVWRFPDSRLNDVECFWHQYDSVVCQIDM